MKDPVFSRRDALATLSAAILAPRAARADSAFAPAATLARGLDQLHALLISQDGALAVAQTFRGPGLDTPVNVKSVSKTLVSALCGIALERGEIPSVDAPVAPYLGRVIPRRGDDRLRQISFRHLLTMQSGLTPFAGSTYGGWVAGDHWIYDALSAPMVADPGTERLYSTANTHILGTALANAADTDLHRLAQERLGDPLDLALPPWTRDPQGNYLGGNDMRVSPRGMLRFGQAYLHGGQLDGTRIVPKTWVDASWRPTAPADIPGHAYGYGWFLWTVDGVQVRYARGYGGQMIYVVPDRRLVVVMTSDISRPATMAGHLGRLHALVEGVILPASDRA